MKAILGWLFRYIFCPLGDLGPLVFVDRIHLFTVQESSDMCDSGIWEET